MSGFKLYRHNGDDGGWPTALNDAGEFAFLAYFTDYTEGIFVATVPEPSTLALLLVTSCGIFLKSGRKSHWTVTGKGLGDG